jgi:hypothetical protein
MFMQRNPMNYQRRIFDWSKKTQIIVLTLATFIAMC